jgi:general secretion pathway protein C
VATQARIVPSFQNGKPNGFKLFSIRPGSLYSKIGIQNGDVIQKINGYEMNDPAKAFDIYSKLKDSSAITVDIVRRGRTQTMTYNIR